MKLINNMSSNFKILKWITPVLIDKYMKFSKK